MKDAPIPKRWLRSYGRSLSKYHLHPETKLLGGDWTDTVTTRRRHVVATGALNIGKEAYYLEELVLVGDDDGQIDLGISPNDRARMVAAIDLAKRRCGVRALRRAAGVSDRTVAAAISGFRIVSDYTLVKIAEAGADLASEAARREAEVAGLLECVGGEVDRRGRNAVAASLSFDPDNLGKVLNGSRRASSQLLDGLRNARSGMVQFTGKTRWNSS